MRSFLNEWLPTIAVLTAVLAVIFLSHHQGKQQGQAQRQMECRAAFDALQVGNILANDPDSRWKRNWEYIETLLCDGAEAGEAQ